MVTMATMMWTRRNLVWWWFQSGFPLRRSSASTLLSWVLSSLRVPLHNTRPHPPQGFRMADVDFFMLENSTCNINIMCIFTAVQSPKTHFLHPSHPYCKHWNASGTRIAGLIFGYFVPTRNCIQVHNEALVSPKLSLLPSLSSQERRLMVRLQSTPIPNSFKSSELFLAISTITLRPWPWLRSWPRQ